MQALRGPLIGAIHKGRPHPRGEGGLVKSGHMLPDFVWPHAAREARGAAAKPISMIIEWAATPGKTHADAGGGGSVAKKASSNSNFYRNFRRLNSVLCA